MKIYRVYISAIIMACLAVLIACKSIQNEGDTDWAEVRMVIDQPLRSQSGSPLAATVEAGSILVSAVPATIEAVDASTDLSTAHDRQMLNLTSNGVSLSIPLNEPIRLVLQGFSDSLSLTQALAATATSTGLSDTFTVSGDTSAKTVTVAMTAVSSTPTLTGAWTFVDGNGATGINVDTSHEAKHPMLMSFSTSSELFAVWQEYNDSNIYQVYVSKWDGSSSWSRPTAGWNYSSSLHGQYPRLLDHDGGFYVVWAEGDGSTDQTRAARYTGSVTFLPGNTGSTGLNKMTSRSIKNPKAISLNNKMYMAWSEKNTGGISQIRVAEYDGSTVSFIDGNGDVGINKDSTKDAYEPFLAGIGTHLYVAWHEKGVSDVPQIRVAKWTGGSTWEFADGNHATDGLNKDATKSTFGPELINIDTKVYVAWTEKNQSSIDHIRVAELASDGTRTFIDGNGNDGLNKVASNYAYLPRVVQMNSKLYIAWMESPYASMEPTAQARVIEGDLSSGSWRFVDGNGTVGINKDSTAAAQEPYLAVHDSKLYAIWSEKSSSGEFQIRVAEAQTE